MEDGEIHEAVSDALRGFAVEMEQYINAAGEAAAIHRTDLNALSHAMDALHVGARLTPGDLASRMGLSPSATTSMLDRLQAAGHIVRSRDSPDRRVVTVTITAKAEQAGYEIFVPLVQAFEQVMAAYSPSELELLRRFLEQASAAVHAARAPTKDQRSV